MGTQIGDGVVGTRNLEGTQDSDLPNFIRAAPSPLPLRVTQNKPWTSWLSSTFQKLIVLVLLYLQVSKIRRLHFTATRWLIQLIHSVLLYDGSSNILKPFKKSSKSLKYSTDSRKWETLGSVEVRWRGRGSFPQSPQSLST